MWYKEKYRIVTENPYNKEKLNGLGDSIGESVPL